MRVIKSALVLSAFVGLTACVKEQPAPEADLALLDDLKTELAMEQAESQKVVSAVELGTAAQAAKAAEVKEEAPAAPKPAVRRASTTRSASSSTASRSSSSAGSYEAPVRQPRVVTVKHTKRDAAIGAVAGAAVGAVAGGSQRRVQGAVVGAVLGGVAGGIIGNNVDKSTRVEY